MTDTMSAKKEGQTRGSFYRLRPLDWFLVAVPLAFLIRFIPAWKNETLLFFISGVALIPLAAWLGRATEHLSARAGPGAGGLLNATLGNAPELILSLAALSKGLIVVVKASITGSILGNILFVLGTAILAGGTRFPHQRFNQTATRIAATSLSLAVIGLIIPTIFHAATERQSDDWSSRATPELSLAVAVVLFVTYILWLVFSLITHRDLFMGTDPGDVAVNESKKSAWPVSKAFIVLALAAIFIAVMSEFRCRFGGGRLQISRSNGGFRRGDHCRDHQQCKRVHGSGGGAKKSNGFEFGYRRRFEPADRIVHHTCSHFCLLFVRAANDARVFVAGGGRSLAGCGDCRPYQRRRRMQLVRRRPTSCRLPDYCGPLLFPSSTVEERRSACTLSEDF